MHQWQTAQLHALVAALYLENFATFRRYCHFSHDQLLIALDASRTVQLPARWQAVAMLPMTITGDTILLAVEGGEYASEIPLADFMTVLTTATWWPAATREKAQSLWQHALAGRAKLADLATEFSSLNSVTKAKLEQDFELLAMQIDRPNHPFAHAKGELLHLLVAPTTQVQWWAVPKAQIFSKQVNSPATQLLAPTLQAELEQVLHGTLEAKGVNAQDYLALPALPSEQPIIDALQFALPLPFQSEVQAATSSLRSFYYQADQHLKFATSQATLGAKRTMPARYLHNGDAAFALLQQILQRDTKLAACVQLCDEQAWWVSGAAPALVDCQGEIGVQLRYFPATPAATLPRFTMAALNHPAAWRALQQAGFDIASLWPRLITAFTRTMLTLWQYGVLPECHGQNIQLWLDEQQDWQFILRDHDTLRICRAQLEQQQLPVPDYQINWHTPNTLVLDDQTKLLAYFTTLGIQVNLYPIACALSKLGDYNEAEFWQQLQQSIEAVATSFAEPQQQILTDALLRAKAWPFKAILTPLLNADDQATGMPSALFDIANPLRQVSRYVAS
ncbi:IucA/IucC family protein [Pseudoalteromonas fenneropenaei]|uniref:IucA/IucC family protein n=1 Tax=Pseudoalteromonas fenneropenaei TaxID=1737459 RepID=A0ABV7CJ49_9GAMM